MSVSSRKELLEHLHHQICIAGYGGSPTDDFVNATVECEDCSLVLIDSDMWDQEEDSVKTAEVMHTADGNPIIHAQLVHEGGGGMRRGWIILADISAHNDIHPYVTWWMDVDGHTFAGDYCETYEKALASFEAACQVMLIDSAMWEEDGQGSHR